MKKAKIDEVGSRKGGAGQDGVGRRDITTNDLLGFDVSDETRVIQTIKEGLTRSISDHDLDLTLFYIGHLEDFFDLRYRFVDTDLVDLVDTTYAAVVSGSPKMSSLCAPICAELLSKAAKNKYVAKPVIPWRPLYAMYSEQLAYKTRPVVPHLPGEDSGSSLQAVVQSARRFFPPGSNAEIVALLEHHLYNTTCVDGFMAQKMWCAFVVPMVECDSWVPNVFRVWDTVKTEDGCWNQPWMVLLSQAARKHIGRFPYSEENASKLFTVALRDLDVVLAGSPEGLETVSTISGFPCQRSLARILVYSLEPSSTILIEHFSRYLATVAQYFNSSNDGRWSNKLGQLMAAFANSLIKRAKKERSPKSNIAVECRLTDIRYRELIAMVVPLMIQGIFSTHLGMRDHCLSALQSAGCLCPDIVRSHLTPRLFEALQTETEIHQINVAIGTLAVVTPFLAPEDIWSFAMLAVPGIDPNDIQKCASTLNFYYSICMRQKLTQERHADWCLVVLDRLFAYFQHCEPVSKASRSDGQLPSLIRRFSCLFFAQQDVRLRKLMRGKIYDHLMQNGRENSRSIGIFTEALVVTEPKSAVNRWVPQFCELLAVSDIPKTRAVWLLTILSRTVRSASIHLLPHLSIVQEVIDRCLVDSRKVMRKLGAKLLKRVLRSLTQYYVIDWTSEAEKIEKSDLVGQSVLHVPSQDEWDAAGALATKYVEMAEQADPNSCLYICRALLEGLLGALGESREGLLEAKRPECWPKRLYSSTPATFKPLRARIGNIILNFSRMVPQTSLKGVRRVSKSILRFFTNRSVVHKASPDVTAILRAQNESKLNKKRKFKPLFVMSLLSRHRSRSSCMDSYFLNNQCNRSLIERLFELSLHEFEDVRIVAQRGLISALSVLPDSAREKLPTLISHLRDVAVEEHIFKGVTYTLEVMINYVVNEWDKLALFIGALCRCSIHDAKPKLQDRIDSLFDEFIRHYFNLKVEVAAYDSVVTDVLSTINESTSWRYLCICMSVLLLFIRKDHPVDVRIARLFGSMLSHDVVTVRSLASTGIQMMLQLADPLKAPRKRPPVFVEGPKVDVPQQLSNDIHGTIFACELDMKSLMVHMISTHHFPDADKKPSGIQYMMTLFGVAGPGEVGGGWVATAISPLIQLQKPFPSTFQRIVLHGFRLANVSLWKGLFKAFGPRMWTRIEPHIGAVFSDVRREAQSVVIEVVAGAVAGSKKWTEADQAKLGQILLPYIQKSVANCSHEAIEDWEAFVRYTCQKRCPSWLVDWIYSDIFASENSTSLTKRLKLVYALLCEQGAQLKSQNIQLCERLAAVLDHPFAQVRTMVALVCVLMYECGVEGVEFETFLDNLMRRATVEENSKLRHTAVYFWADVNRRGICTHVALLKSRLPAVTRMLFAIYNDSDHDVQALARSTTPLIAQFIYGIGDHPLLVSHLDTLRELIVATQSTWMVKVALGPFVQIMAFNHRFVLSSRDVDLHVVPLINALLCDVNIDVRQSGAQAMRSVMTGETRLQVIQARIEEFKQWASRAVRKRSRRKMQARDQSKVPLSDEESHNVVMRHGGVLGFCALLGTSPYDVPDWLPDVSVAVVQHINDPDPIRSTVRESMQDFWRTHKDNLHKYESKWSSGDLALLKELSQFAPSYFL